MVKATLQNWRHVAFAGIALAALSSAAIAEPLSQTVCKALIEEQAQLTKRGVIADRERGPEWAKANVGAERVKEILHSIDVEEQLLFRCRIGGLTVAAKRAGEQADKIELNPNNPDAAKPGAKGTPPAAGQKAPPAGHKVHRKKTNDAAAAADAGEDQPKPVRRKKTRKHKPKVNDAYSPPSATTSVMPNPFGSPSAAGGPVPGP